MKNPLGASYKKPVIPIKCKDCIYYQRIRTFDKPCKELGILSNSDPCSRFVSDVFEFFPKDKSKSGVLVKYGNKNTISILNMLGTLSSSDLRRLAALSLAEYRSRSRSGLTAGQIVYVKILGDSSQKYLNCYIKATVLSCTRHYIMVKGRGKNKLDGYFSYNSKSVLTESQWKRLKKSLIKNNKINLPQSPRFLGIKKSETYNYEPPTIDDILDKKEDSRIDLKEISSKRKKRKKLKKTIRLRG